MKKDRHFWKVTARPSQRPGVASPTHMYTAEVVADDIWEVLRLVDREKVFDDDVDEFRVVRGEHV